MMNEGNKLCISWWNVWRLSQELNQHVIHTDDGMLYEESEIWKASFMRKRFIVGKYRLSSSKKVSSDSQLIVGYQDSKQY